MARALETVHGESGDDAQRRTMYSIDSIGSFERENPMLDVLHYFWSTLRKGADATPHVAEFDITKIVPHADARFLSWVDATPEDPRNFIMARHPASPIPGMGAELTGKRLGDIPIPLHAQSVFVEYQRCKRWKTPLFHEIEQIIGGYQRHYYRLLLPLANEKGDVTRIVYMSHFLTPPRQLYDPKEYGGRQGPPYTS